jgi:hypothetical protein
MHLPIQQSFALPDDSAYLMKLDPTWVELTRLGYIQTVHEDYSAAEDSYRQAYEIALNTFIAMPETDIANALYDFSHQNLLWVQQRLAETTC